MRQIIYIFIFSLSVVTVKAQYTVSHYSGNGHAGFLNGNINVALFNTPFGICRDKKGNLYITDAGNNCIRKIDAQGNVTTYAGNLTAGLMNAKDTAARFNGPVGICADDAGNVYVADFNNQCIRKIDVNQNVTTIAGSGTEGFKDGDSSVAKFDYPRGIVIDKAGNLYVADSWNHRIRKIDALTHAVSTYAGGGTSMGVQSIGALVNDTASAARFYTPSGLTIDGNGNLYVADAYNNRIRMVDTLRNVTTVAGSGPTGLGTGAFADSTALLALLNVPTDLFYTTTGNLLIGDTYNNRVRLLANSSLSTIAGNGNDGYKQGNGKQAEFDFPRGITANAAGDSIWVIDYNNSAIRLITFNNTLVTNINTAPARIYPNPASNKIWIQFPNDGIPANIQIADCLGRVVLVKENMYEQNSTIDISALPNGMYFITTARNGERSTGKLVKE